MRASRCPACGAPSTADSDFCACGAYLAWDDVPAEPPAAPDQATTATLPALAVVPALGTARLLLRAAGGDAADPVPLDALRVAAGSQLMLTATVRNESAFTDHFTVAVEGLPPSWVELRPARAYLLPVGPHGDFEREVAIAIRPPHASSATAGAWPFAVTVDSDSRRAEDARVGAVVTVEPFGALELDARPAIATGRRGASFACEVRNIGNVEALAALRASDAEKACAFDLPAGARLQPGQPAPMTVRVRPLRTLWVGRPVDHRVQLEAGAPQAPAPAKAAPVVYRQRPWVAWWVPPLLMLLAAAAAALWLLLPRTVTMPAVVGATSAFAAQQQLAHAGLRTEPQVRAKVVRGVAAGTVVEQSPRAGSRVAPTAAVALVVAAAPATTIVPDLRRLHPAQADTVLTRMHLRLGAVSPQLVPQARIHSQTPRAGAQRPQGTVVNVVLAPRLVRVPDVRGRPVRQAQRLLHRAGLSLGRVAPRLRPGARVGSQLPVPGSRRRVGTHVDVVLARLTVLVPSLAGMTVQDADTALQTCRLRLGPLPPDLQPTQLVAGQVPAAGRREPTGSAVTAIFAPVPATTAPSGGSLTTTAPPATTAAQPPPPLPTPQECAAR